MQLFCVYTYTVKWRQREVIYYLPQLSSGKLPLSQGIIGNHRLFCSKVDTGPTCHQCNLKISKPEFFFFKVTKMWLFDWNIAAATHSSRFSSAASTPRSSFSQSADYYQGKLRSQLIITKFGKEYSWLLPRLVDISAGYYQS